MQSIIKTKVVATVFIALLAMNAQAQRAADLLKSYKGEKETTMINIPGFAAKMAINKKEFNQDHKDVLKKMKGLKILLADEADEKTKSSLVSDLIKSFKKYDYKPLIQVKSDDENVNIQFLPATKKNKGELVLLVDGTNEFVTMVIEGDFTENDARQLAKSLNKN